MANVEILITLSHSRWIVLEKTRPGVYVIKESSEVTEDWGRDLLLGFFEWDDEVEDLSGDSRDECGMSTHLRWQDVDLTDTEIRAPSIERIEKAFEHIVIGSYDPADI